MHNLAPLNEEEESCINSILDAGIDEMKSNQESILTSQIMKKSQFSINNTENTPGVSLGKCQQSNALKDIITSMRTSNNYISSSEEETFHPNNKITKINKTNQGVQPSNNQRLKEMKNKLASLQQRISSMDSNLTSHNNNIFQYDKQPMKNKTYHHHGKSLSNRSNSTQRLLPKKTAFESHSRKKYRSASGRVDPSNKAKKIKNDLSEMRWKEKYLKLKSDFDSSKNILMNHRRKYNELNKKWTQLNRKPFAYDELFEDNQRLIESNENQFTKFEESEEIRSEQAKLIYSLQKEVERLRSEFETNDIIIPNNNDNKVNRKRKN